MTGFVIQGHICLKGWSLSGKTTYWCILVNLLKCVLFEYLMQIQSSGMKHEKMAQSNRSNSS